MPSAMWGQGVPAGEKPIPVPTDWSHHHVIFSRPGTTEQAARVQQDPRYWQQQYRRELPVIAPAAERGIALQLPASQHVSKPPKSQKPKGDWQENLGTGGSIGAGNYPAKFSFLGTTANCGSATQPDFVVYSTGLAGSASQASIVAYDNLYSGCTGTVPSTYWAYNTQGQILTSPAFSRDGSQVAFVETNGGFGILVLLKWAASTSETISSPLTLTAVSNGSYRTCTAPCMTTIDLKDRSGVQTDDTTSSVFADLSDDTAWVGGAFGWLHKITGIFLGRPAEVTGGSFPVQMSSGNVLSSPVHDYASGNVFVGDAGGYLYRVDSTSGAVTATSELDFGSGIVQGPIVDSTSGLVYVFASSDDSDNCTNGNTNCAVVYELTTSFATGAVGSEVVVGASTAPGSTTPNPMYIGAFDIAYENSTNATGNLYVCGNTGGAPTLYQVPVVAGAFPSSGNGTSVALLTATLETPACSPVTDVYNPNAAGGATEKVFVSVENDGLNSGCGGGGCLFNFVDTQWQESTPYNIGQEVLAVSSNDGHLYIYVVAAPGISGAMQPHWPNSAGAEFTDGSMQWIDQGPLSGGALSAWRASQHYVPPSRILDNDGNVEVVTVAGTTGTTAPAWSTAPGGTTMDGTVTWINAGALGSFVLPAAGGTSGIVIDNTVGAATQGGASQIYFSTLSNQTCTTSGTSGGCAVQASQSALQ
ncbi:MAG TPA: hypothetical protein VFF50_11440 [Candidatus Deferrimicrobiaceae bacterium]|nr:hypothetical protein [Candidatus Deferrimicrobiaceae bacterium]